MSYVSYSDLNSLEEISFIAGNEYTLEFTVYKDDGTPQDLGGSSVFWVMCPFGQFGINVLQKTATITGTNTFTVTLDSADTQDLDGKYIHQPVIQSFSGVESRPAQGVILVIPQIPSV